MFYTSIDAIACIQAYKLYISYSTRDAVIYSYNTLYN